MPRVKGAELREIVGNELERGQVVIYGMETSPELSNQLMTLR
ncbi:MAG: hypothetical protein WBB19_04795 [Desulforhopalus sp.]